MSLDISFYSREEQSEECRCERCDNVHQRVWNECLFDANITHNLGKMADAAGIYEIVWRPDENHIQYPEQMVGRLEKGIAAMKADPVKFKSFDSPNQWGTYKDFLPWLETLLQACRDYPLASISVSR